MRQPLRLLPARAVSAVVLAALLTGGCGLGVASPDLLQITRAGGGRPLSLVVGDGGTVRCGHGPRRAISSQDLLDARGLTHDLEPLLRRGGALRSGRGEFTYLVRTQEGSFSFPDTAANARPALGRAEELTLRLARIACGRA